MTNEIIKFYRYLPAQVNSLLLIDSPLLTHPSSCHINHNCVMNTFIEDFFHIRKLTNQSSLIKEIKFKNKWTGSYFLSSYSLSPLLNCRLSALSSSKILIKWPSRICSQSTTFWTHWSKGVSNVPHLAYFNLLGFKVKNHVYSIRIAFAHQRICVLAKITVSKPWYSKHSRQFGSYPKFI